MKTENVSQVANTSRVYRFDIFKGVVGPGGKIEKMRSVGIAYHTEGLATYHVHLKTFLNDAFFLLPEETSGQYGISTRGPSTFPGRKYFWHKVGAAVVLSGQNAGLMRLSFDLVTDDIYMNLYPKDSFETEGSRVEGTSFKAVYETKD